MSRGLHPAVITAAALLALGTRLVHAGGIEVPVDGALSANNPDPQLGETAYLYLNATPRENVPSLTLAVKIPAGTELVSGTRTQQVFAAVAAGQTATLTVPVRVVATGEKQVLGSATLTDTPGLRLSRGFVLLLNAEPKPLPKTQVGKDQKGQPLIIYEGGKH